MSQLDDSETVTPRTLIEGFLAHKQASQSVIATPNRDHGLRRTPNKYQHPPELAYIHHVQTRSASKRQSSDAESNTPQESKRAHTTQQLVENVGPSPNQSRSRRRLSHGNRRKTLLSTKVMRTQLLSVETPRFTPKSAIDAFLSHALEQTPTLASQADVVANKSRSSATDIFDSSHQLIVQSPLSESAVFHHVSPVSKQARNKVSARPPVNFTLDSIVEDMGDDIREMSAEQSSIETETQHHSDIHYTEDSDADDEDEGEDRSNETRLKEHNSLSTISDKETSVGAEHRTFLDIIGHDHQASISTERDEITRHIDDDKGDIDTDNIDGAVKEHRHSKRHSEQNSVDGGEDNSHQYIANDDDKLQSLKDANSASVHAKDYIIDNDDEGERVVDGKDISGHIAGVDAHIDDGNAQSNPISDAEEDDARRRDDNTHFNGADRISDAEEEAEEEEEEEEEESHYNRTADEAAVGYDRADQLEADRDSDDSEARSDDKDERRGEDAPVPGDDEDDADPVSRHYAVGIEEEDVDDELLEATAYRQDENNSVVDADGVAADDDKTEENEDDIDNDEGSADDGVDSDEPRPSTSYITQSSMMRITEKIAPKKIAKPRHPRKIQDGMPTSLTKSIFTHFCRRKVRKETIAEVEKVADEFWKRVVNDLDAYTKHAGRKTIEFEDVELLMKRQGFTSEKCTMDSLVRKYLPLEYRQALIPMAQSGNKLLIRK